MIARITADSPALAVPLPPKPYELEACYSYCEAVAHARTHNFPVASFFVPAALRRHIWAIYAFARTADDIADEPSFEGRRAGELDAWEEQLHACYFGEPSQHPVFVALRDTVKRFDLPITEFSALLSAFRTDLEETRYSSFAELRSYTARAAEPVGHLLLYLGGYRDPVLHRYADDLASGLAMASLWQHLPADAARDRVYVPAEDLRHFGVTARDLVERRPTDEVGALVRYLAARTRALFVRARPLVDKLGDDLAVEVALIWLGGMRILRKLDRAGANAVVDRPRLSALDKAEVVRRAVRWRGGSIARRILR